MSVDGSEDRVNETADLTKTGNGVNLDNNVSKEQVERKEKENEERKGNGGDQRVEGKENEGSSSESKNESKKGRLAPVREKCDSSSNHCMDDDKTLVACLRVPGNGRRFAFHIMRLKNVYFVCLEFSRFTYHDLIGFLCFPNVFEIKHLNCFLMMLKIGKRFVHYSSTMTRNWGTPDL